MIRRLSTLSILVILSLIPAILLFLLFGELNNAGVQWTGGPAFQLGGPIAAFFVTLWFLWGMYKEMQQRENPLEVQLEALVGTWEVESKSSVSGRKACSETSVTFGDGELHIAGGTFFDIAADGSKGDPIGTWDVEMAISDGRRLKYFYSLTDRLATHPTWRGLVELALQEDSDTLTFYGTWQVIGKEIHSGEIEMKKTK